MQKFTPFSIQPNYENILSLIKSNTKYAIFEILSQDNIIQSINHQNSQISQFLFKHIADLFNISIRADFNKDNEIFFYKKEVVKQEKSIDHQIDSDASKIELKNEYDTFKVSSNAREVLVALSINFPAQFSENTAFHLKMNQILDTVNEIENNPQSKRNPKIVKRAEEEEEEETNKEENFSNENNDTNNQIFENFPISEINANLSVVLLSRIIFSLGKSENYSILASLSDDQDFFPKFCSLLGTHCAVYDTLFSLSNDDMPAVSLFFEDMDSTEMLLEMIKSSFFKLKALINSEEQNNAVQNSWNDILNNYNVSIAYFNIDDIFRMQKRALIIISHLISNADKDSNLVKNLSEKVDYLTFLFENLGLHSLSKDVSANVFSLLIRLYQISSNPTVVNKSIYNPFMSSKKQSPEKDDSDYDDYDLDYDSDYDSCDCFSKMSKKKGNPGSPKRIKKVPLIKSFFESNANAICQYVIDSVFFSISTEKALEVLCLILHMPEVQDKFFNQIENSNLLQTMIEKLINDFFSFPNCSVLHTNFRKIFSLILKIEEQKQIDEPERKRTPFVSNVCNYLEKIILFLDKEKMCQKESNIENQYESKIVASNDETTKQEDKNCLKNDNLIEDKLSVNTNFDNNNNNENILNSLNDITSRKSNENDCSNDSNENPKPINTNDNNNMVESSLEAKDFKDNENPTSYLRYDFTKHCFWGFVVEFTELIEEINNDNGIKESENNFWTQFIQNDVNRFKCITSHEYGGSAPQGTRTYGKILCVRSPSSSSSGQKPRSFMKKVSETLSFGDDSDGD